MTEPLPDGIYFNLPEDEYHRQTAVGSTDLKRVLASAPDYWWHSHMNLLAPEDVPTDYKSFGSGFHTLVLEGEETFRNTYVIEPSVDEFIADGAKVFKTVDEIKDLLRKHEIKLNGTKKELGEKFDRLVLEKKLADHVLWDNVTNEFEANKAGRVPLKRKDYERILLSHAYIKKNPHLKEAFEDGYPEVSIFWTDKHGIKCKARLDYLKLKTVSDLKSFRNRMRRQIPYAITSTIKNEHYDIQFGHYYVARMQMARLILDGKVFGDNQPPEDWLMKLAGVREFSWVWVFYQAAGAPLARGYKISPKNPKVEQMLQQQAHLMNVLADNYEQHGKEIWVDTTPVEEYSVENEPQWGI